MRIDDIRPEAMRPADVRPASSGESRSGAKKKETGRRSPRRDRVEISEEARALAAQLDGAAPGLSPERIAEIQGKIQRGEYNTPAVAEHVARRLVDSGEL